MAKSTEAWGSRVGLILAMAGNAVGLGNFLRFPVQAVQNGGGTFIIPYLVSFLLMGIPLLWVEWAMGRFGGRFGDHSTPFILDNMTKRRFWKYFGVFGIFTNMGVMAYYTYIESWTLTYTLKSLKGDFLGVNLDQLDTYFNNYVDLGSGINFPVWALLAFVITLTINIYILSKGLSGGIEKVAKIAMPLLIGFGAFLAIMSWTTGSTGRCEDCSTFVGLNFLWEPDFSSLSNPKIWLAAAGQIFFTLSVGMGTIHCYSSYLSQRDDIALNAMSAGWVRVFFIVLLVTVGFLTLVLWQGYQFSGELGFRKALFNVVSITTGTGYASADYSTWGPVALVVFFYAGLVGGCAGSTSCSVKVFRYQLLVSAIHMQLRKIHSPSGVFNLRYQGRIVGTDVINSVISFFVIFFVSLGVSAMALALTGLDLLTAFSGAAAALANIGPGLGEVIGPSGNYSTLSDSAKWILAFTMLLGRLELLAVYTLCTLRFWRN